VKTDFKNEEAIKYFSDKQRLKMYFCQQVLQEIMKEALQTDR
jgi:hypothetical protein